MLSLAKAGDDNAKPDAFSFNAVINAFIYSPRNVIRDAGKRAESILERGLEFAEENTQIFIHTFFAVTSF